MKKSIFDPSLFENYPYNGCLWKLQVTNAGMLRGYSGHSHFGWIGEKHSRFPDERYNTSRPLASVKWGPNKAGLYNLTQKFNCSTLLWPHGSPRTGFKTHGEGHK